MMNLKHRKNMVWVSLAASILLGIFLWWQSDAPPYAHPMAEFNDNWWGPLASMAYKWRHFILDFWDLNLAGGCSLYLMGRYPIFNIFNAGAWFLNDDWMLLFMFIAPYVMGLFFMMLLLLDVFGLTLIYALFGGLLYLGMSICIHTALLEQPIFLFGNFLFPAMVYVYLKSEGQSMYRRAIYVGSVVAVQFAFAGIIQFFQVLIWWLICLFINFIFSLKANPLEQTKKWLIASVLLVAMAFGMAGVQFIPTLYYALTGAGRIPSETYYPINNFPLGEIGSHLTKAFFSPGILSGKIVTALFLVGLALVVSNGREFLRSLSHKSFLLCGWVATILYLLTPTLVEIITSAVPQASLVFSPLRTFTFKYGLHILDFFLSVTLCLILSNENLKISQPSSPAKKILAWIFVFIAVLFVGLPVLFINPAIKSFLLAGPSMFSYFEPARPWMSLSVFFVGIVLFPYFVWRPKHKAAVVIFMVALLSLGIMRTLASFHHQEKGKRVDVSKFHLSTPEIQLYHSAKGKFLLPYDYYGLASFNYNLVYGVHGTMGSESLSPIRFNRFLALYNGQANTHILAPGLLYITRASNALTTYFPVDFTTIAKDETLPWHDFRKVVSGEYFDIWSRKGETKPIEFASSLQCANLSEIIDQFKQTPFNGHIIVTKEDCRTFHLNEKKLLSAASSSEYFNYNRPRADQVQFSVRAKDDAFVFVKDMYQLGWQAKVDRGQSGNFSKFNIFPAHYLFIGFELPKGEHTVELKFTPPLLYWGAFINLICIGILFLTAAKGRPQKS